jgi:ribosomal RNA-processing protein 9
MSSFFTIPSGQKKRKRPTLNVQDDSRKRVATPREPKSTHRRPQRDESISGSDDESDNGPRDLPGDQDAQESSSGSEGEEEETAAERRLRLAERYLDNIRSEVAADDEVGFDAEDIDRDLIAERLQEDAAESKGRMYRKLAEELNFEGASHSWAKWNEQSVTGVAACAPWAYTVGKGLDLVKWRIQDLPADQWPQKGVKKSKKAKPPPKKRPEQVSFVRGDKSRAKDSLTYQGHVDSILCVAASQDGKYVATGGQDRRIVIWDAQTLKCLKVFNQHRDAVTSLVFRRGTNQMYSASKDRTVKIWSLDELAYVETLFGHQDEVVSSPLLKLEELRFVTFKLTKIQVDIAALSQERCISVGARDRTARLWKVVEETQLVRVAVTPC